MAEEEYAAEKQSFESNAEIQRWIRTQAAEGEDAFSSEFLTSHHERDWIMSSLAVFHGRGLITNVRGQVQPGKEANVYCCDAHPGTGAEFLAAKIYRPRMFRSLKNEAVYRENRAVERDSRRRRAMRKKTRKGRAFQVEDWIRYEFETQRLLYEAEADVPRPYAQAGNGMLMEYFGDAADAAPRLQDVVVAREEARQLFDVLIDNVRLFLACDRVHGDLSAYNVLYWDGRVTIIDFAQAVDARQGSQVFSLLVRDIERLCTFFAPHGVDARPQVLATELWQRYQFGQL